MLTFLCRQLSSVVSIWGWDAVRAREDWNQTGRFFALYPSIWFIIEQVEFACRNECRLHGSSSIHKEDISPIHCSPKQGKGLILQGRLQITNGRMRRSKGPPHWSDTQGPRDKSYCVCEGFRWTYVCKQSQWFVVEGWLNFFSVILLG